MKQYFLGNTQNTEKRIDRNKPIERVMIFTNARNERRIREWAAHHLLLGFSCIYIFDHKSIVPIKDLFQNFDKRVFVERCDLSIPPKLPLMRKAALIASSMKMDWFIYLDADEYLYMQEPCSVKTMLQRFTFADSVSLNWLLFGTNHHTKEPTNQLLVEAYTKSESVLNEHVKTFVRPGAVKQVLTPHYYEVFQPLRMFSIDGTRMTLPYSFHKNKYPLEKNIAFIAHYIYQSEETYMQRKIIIPQDDTGAKREIDKELHSKYNDMENNLLREKYAFQIRRFLAK